jgi:predicted metal-binding protein
MQHKDEERYQNLVAMAIQNGAKAAKIIPTRMVVVDERVRLKCEVPMCSGYNQFLTCPPHVMAVDTFSRILSRYNKGLLLQVEAVNIDSTDKSSGRISKAMVRKGEEVHRPYKLKLLQIVEMVEAAAFKKGMRFAAGFIGGSCPLCEQCVDNKIADPCRHPFRARPAMEGVGIDVFQTVQNAGLSLSLSSSKNVLWTGLVLLE